VSISVFFDQAKDHRKTNINSFLLSDNVFIVASVNFSRHICE